MHYLIKGIIIFNLILAQYTTVVAQKKSKASKKSYPSIQLGDKYFKNLEYYLAAQEYAKALEVDPQNKYAIFQIAESYRHFFHYDNAELNYKRLLAIDEEDEYPLTHFWYAVMLKLNGKYEEAQENLQMFIDDPKVTGTEMESYKIKAKVELDGCALAIKEMKVPQKEYNFENLPIPVNTAHSDYSPVIFENDSSIAIASARKESEGKEEFGWLGGDFSDSYRFVKADSNWAEMHNEDLFSKLHTELNESPGSFTKDKKKFYFTRCDETTKSGNTVDYLCAIYMVENKDNKWQEPVKLNENINVKGQWNAQPFINETGDTLYFVSKRDGGLGMHDIYMSTSSGNEEWGTAVNMGDKINTEYIDMSPCYYAKEKALFFASNGHEGFGGLDIFIAKGDSFSQVRNAGLPFNSNKDDFYFTLGEDKGFLSSNRDGGKGNDDIYRFNIKGKECVIASVNKDSLEDAKSISILGVLKYKDSSIPAPNLEILLKDKKGVLLKKTLTDETGLFRLENLDPEDYKVLLEDFDPRLTFEVKYVVDNVQIKKSSQVATRTLFENIYFDFDKYYLRPEAKKVLDELVAYYNANPEIQIEMNANTDAFGTNDYNVKLSKNRGNTSYKYLLSKGVKNSAIVTNAKGEGIPIATNNNPGGRQLNRRVEFYIVGGPGYVAKAMAYVIEPKTTLYAVAKKFNMSVDELKELNALTNENIIAFRPLRVRRTGDEDIIAPATIAFVETTKITNETFSVDEPSTKNKVNSLNETAGLEPDPQPEQKIKKEPLSSQKSTSSEGTYMVKDGDTMYSIAKRFNITLDELKEMNKLDSYVLYEHMVLKVKK